jgi:hypothetical protein
MLGLIALLRQNLKPSLVQRIGPGSTVETKKHLQVCLKCRAVHVDHIHGVPFGSRLALKRQIGPAWHV